MTLIPIEEKEVGREGKRDTEFKFYQFLKIF